MTSSERRIGLVRRAVAPPGEAKPDWEIVAGLARHLGHGAAFAWRNSAEVFDEFAACTAGRPCDMTGVSHERLRRQGGVQWPAPKQVVGEHEGTVRLYENGRFPTPDGRARFAPTPHAAPAETPDPEFPLLLTTGRVADQWHTMTRTGHSPTLSASAGEATIACHPLDAAAAGAGEGDPVCVISRRGELRVAGHARRGHAARRRVRPVSLGRDARRRRRGRAERADARRRRPDLQAARAEGRRRPAGARAQARRPGQAARARHAEAARRRRHRDGRPGRRRGGAAPPAGRRTGRSSCSARSPDRPTTACCSPSCSRARAGPASSSCARWRGTPTTRSTCAAAAAPTSLDLAARTRDRRRRHPPSLRRARARDRLAGVRPAGAGRRPPACRRLSHLARRRCARRHAARYRARSSSAAGCSASRPPPGCVRTA